MFDSCESFPQRDTLMYLSTITAQDFPAKYKLFNKSEVRSLKTSDIDGARPELKGYRFVQKPDFFSPSDIEKAQPRSYNTRSDKPFYSLISHDITKSQSANPSKRNTNPLEPVYNLPQFQPTEPPTLKFIRDNMILNENPPPRQFKTRDNINVADILGASPRRGKTINKPDYFDPRDINKSEVKEYYKACNPLMPMYKMRDNDGNIVIIGEVQGSKPHAFKKGSDHKRSLTTSDIDGAGPGTVGLKGFSSKERNYAKPLADVSDIQGAKADTFKKGLNTLRHTHPLEPQYNWKTDDKEPEQPKPKSESTELRENREKFWGEGNTQQTKQVAKMSDKQSEHSAHMSEIRAKVSEKSAKLSEKSPKLSEKSAKLSEMSEKASEKSAKVSEHASEKEYGRLARLTDANQSEKLSEKSEIASRQSNRISIVSRDSQRSSRNSAYGRRKIDISASREESGREEPYEFKLNRSEIEQPGSRTSSRAGRSSRLVGTGKSLL